MNKIVNGIIVLCGLIAFSQPAFSQNLNEKIDSLQQVLEKATTPIAQFTPMRRLSDHYGYSGKPDSVRYYAEQMLKIGTEVQQDSMIALAYGSIANYFSNISDNKKALEYQFKGLGFAEKSGNIQCVWLLCNTPRNRDQRFS